MSDDLVVKPWLVIPGAELAWSAARSSGPGGQNVNKVSTKVELRFDFARSSALDAGTRARLQKLAVGRLDAEGRLLLTSQVSRSQATNLEDAREKLAALVRRALFVPKKRRPTKPTRASKERRLASKRRESEKKRARGVRDSD